MSAELRVAIRLREGEFVTPAGVPAAAHARAGEVRCVLLGRPRDVAGRDVTAETLAGQFARRGSSALEPLRGAYAVVLWDARARRAVAARDPEGGCGLWWHVAGDTVRIASELAPLLADLPRRPAPDEVGLLAWLSGAPLPPNRTLYEGVSRLGPGEALAIANGRVRVETFWAPRHGRRLPVEAGEASAGLRAALGRAVRACAASGGVGVQLSGGLDSSALAVVAAAEGLAPAAYSATFPRHPEVDESRLIEVVARRWRLPVTAAEVTGGSALAGGLAFLDRWAVPPEPPNHFFWQPLLARASADGIRVMINGTGGDELFAASPYLVADRLLRRGPLHAYRLMQRYPGARAAGSRRVVARAARDVALEALGPGPLHRARRRRQEHPVLAADAAARLAEHVDPGAWKRLRGPRWWAHQADTVFFGPDRLGLPDYARRRSAAAGLRTAFPLLGRDLAEHVLALPPELAFDPERTRPLLRAAVRDELPGELRLRAGKSYFNALVSEVVLDTDRREGERLLAGPASETRRYLRPDAVRTLLEGPAAPPHVRAQRLWRVVMTECWLRQEADPRFAEERLAALAAPVQAPTFFPLLGSAAASGSTGRP